VTLTDSTVSSNTSADSGGGIFTRVGNVMLTGSTVSGNTSFADGGGISTMEGDVTLSNSTVTENLAAGEGGGVHVSDNPNSGFNPMFLIENSIVAGNAAGGTAADLRHDFTSMLTINHSLIGNTAGSFILAGTGTGNILNQLALLGPLADNGGPTETHALLPGSPAIDAGDPSIVFNPAEFDQRGAPFARVSGGQIDIGAYEVQAAAVDSADFDNDGDIDGADFLSWQRGFGTSSAGPADGDANSDNNVDGADLSIWESQFGGPAPLAAASAAPALELLSSEPAAEFVVAATSSVDVPQIDASQIVVPSIVVTPQVASIAPSPALARGELVDLALAFSLQDRTDFVRQAKTSLANLPDEITTDVIGVSRRSLAARGPVRIAAETSAFTTQHADDRDDSPQHRPALEDAFDAVFGEELPIA